jgi:hypothetical protein
MLGYKTFFINKDVSNHQIILKSNDDRPDSISEQFEVGHTYELPENIDEGLELRYLCLTKKYKFYDLALELLHSTDPYDRHQDAIYCLIEILGDMIHCYDHHHFSATNKMKIIKIMTKDELMQTIEDGVHKTIAGHQITIMNKKYHSIDDKPAIIRASGNQYWYKEGKLHRSNDLPAIIRIHTNHFFDNDQDHHLWNTYDEYRNKPYPVPSETDIMEGKVALEWYVEGKQCRASGGPSVITGDGSKFWHNGWWVSKIEYSGGSVEWWDTCKIKEIYDGKEYIITKNGLHREGDLPARVFSDGSMEWHQNGIYYRENDKPTSINAHGCQFWQNSKMIISGYHRDDDKPAIIHSEKCFYSNMREWWVNGKRHRENDLPAVMWNVKQSDQLPCLIQEWYYNGVLHREKGIPSVICGGYKGWFHNGKMYKQIGKIGIPIIPDESYTEYTPTYSPTECFDKNDDTERG